MKLKPEKNLSKVTIIGTFANAVARVKHDNLQQLGLLDKLHCFKLFKKRLPRLKPISDKKNNLFYFFYKNNIDAQYNYDFNQTLTRRDKNFPETK